MRMDSRNPLSSRSGKQEPNAIPLYNRRVLFLAIAVNTFEFYRFRFQFRALEPVHFPAGKGANLLRGGFGAVLHETAPSEYSHLFTPGASGGDSPSGLGDWPRPFVIRAAHLDGVSIPTGGSLCFDVHVFDVRAEAPGHFRAAFERLAGRGLGPERGRMELERMEQLDLSDRCETTERLGSPTVITLEPGDEAVERVRVRFVTPTELKSGGEVVDRPEFGILFSRLRDRLSTLRALYGAGPFEIDFRGMGERAGPVRLAGCRLVWERGERRSGRTGMVHPLGGFTGTAEYEGEMREFLPWLRAARWVGVGRQTVWGKGDVRVLEGEKGAQSKILLD
jgi:hypothetical protein